MQRQPYDFDRKNFESTDGADAISQIEHIMAWHFDADAVRIASLVVDGFIERRAEASVNRAMPGRQSPGPPPAKS